MKRVVCPSCGSDNVTLIYDDPETYECLDCGETFDY